MSKTDIEKVKDIQDKVDSFKTKLARAQALKEQLVARKAEILKEAADLGVSPSLEAIKESIEKRQSKIDTTLVDLSNRMQSIEAALNKCQ